jgi:hypothetical protein
MTLDLKYLIAKDIAFQTFIHTWPIFRGNKVHLIQELSFTELFGKDEIL